MKTAINPRDRRPKMIGKTALFLAMRNREERILRDQEERRRHGIPASGMIHRVKLQNGQTVYSAEIVVHS